ncbi:MAG TPA: Smr/MutS family protein [Allosphingosinicella sp.]|nr:Smr/MutS family protein [Allosphingosinicella sp.]
MARRLGAEERALWAKVIATVRPLHPQHGETAATPPAPAPDPPAAPAVAASPDGRQPPPAAARPRRHEGATLDGSWDRRLTRGLVQPDFTVDLHGHHLQSAYHLIDMRLEQAIAAGARVILLVTGKSPAGERSPAARGAIRAAVGDWLAASRHADSIASVRNAHPRHGGAGALYIILRRRRRP